MIPDIGAAVHTVDVAIDKVTAIANAKLPGVESEVTQTSTDFRNLTLEQASFGEDPLALELAKQHQAAHEVFVETVQGVITDLQEFRQKLLDSMKAHENNDDSVHAALISLGKKYDGHTYHSDENWERARREQGDNLGKPVAVPAPQDTSEVAASPTAEKPAVDTPAAPVTDTDSGTDDTPSRAGFN